MASSSTATALQLTIFSTLSLLSFTFLPPSFSATTNHGRPLPTYQPFKKVYAFGDSYTDTGNTRSASGTFGFGQVSNPPYGVTYFKHSTNRYSDGRLIIDFVTEALSLPFLQPYRDIKGNSSLATNGVNFAIAGATSINHAFYVKNNLTLDVTPQWLRTQFELFEKFLENNGCSKNDKSDKCREAIEGALFWVGEIGLNDYSYNLASSISKDLIRRLSVSYLTQFLKALLKRGAKYIVVEGLPPAGCLTLTMYLAPETDRDDLGCVKSVNNYSYAHRLALRSSLDNLRKQFPQAVIVYADFLEATRTVIMNPKKFGFTEKFKACCGIGEPYHFQLFSVCGSPDAKLCNNPSLYINWDGVHFTEAMYKVLTNMYLHENFTHPPFDYLVKMKQHRDGK